ncbi:MAG: hypothetical protein ACOYON_06575 [Fimbriimonas sp.]
MVRRGLTLAQTLLLLGMLLVALGILALVWQKVGGKPPVDQDIRALRKVYVGVSLYQNDNNGAYPLGLDQVQRDLDGPGDLTSTRDPFLKSGGPFPRDAGLLKWAEKSSVRISFLFAPLHVRAGAAEPKLLQDLVKDPATPLVVNPWIGQAVPGAEFSATISGKVQVVRADGSIVSKALASPTAIESSVAFWARN